MVGKPNIPTPQTLPPAPTPALLAPPKVNAKPTLGNTYLTSGMTSTSAAKAAPKPKLMGQ